MENALFTVYGTVQLGGENRKCDQTKDYIEKVDFQELLFAIVNWPNSELYGAFACIMRYLHQSATS